MHATLFGCLVFQLSGCTAIASEAAHPVDAKGAQVRPLARQLIVKFKPQTLPCTAAGIARLSSATATRLEYVRPMSGDACVVRQIGQSGDAADLAQGEQRIRQHPALEWMEPDARMKAF